MRHRYQLAIAALLPVALHSGALTQVSSRSVPARIELCQIQTLSHGMPDHYAPMSLVKVGEKKRKPAMTSSHEVTVVLGPEHDQHLRRVVLEVIVRLGGKLSKRDWGIGGSQEIETVETKIGTDRLVLEAETYVGLSLHGPSQLVHRIEAMVKAEMAKH